MSKKEDFLEEAKGSLKETVNDILSEEISVENIVEHLKKARNVINLLTWESARVLASIKDNKEVDGFERESDINFPVFSKRMIEAQDGNIEEMEEGIGLTLLAINFLKKETEKLIEYFKFYGAKDEPDRGIAAKVKR